MRVSDDLTRTRVTVFFRLLFVIPHFIWLVLWGIFVLILTIANWFIVLFTGRTPDGIHRLVTAYVNYGAHVYAYFWVAANRYPGFTGDPGYEVDIEFDPPAKQNRWTVAFRLPLAIPALMLLAVIAGGGFGGSYSSSASDSSTSTSTGIQLVGVLATAGVIAWFYSLFRARAPEGVARLSWYAIHWAAQVYAYLFLLTDRYPNSDPARLGVPRAPPPHPVTMSVPHHHLERNRVTVFFRLLLALPHLVWLTLWAIGALIVAIINWFATLFTGRSPDGFHRFLAAFVRYAAHVECYVALVGNPFPGFAGDEGSYPIDLEIAGPERQNRWVTGFRLILAIPAFMISSALSGALWVAAFLGWWASLFTGMMPRGLRNLGAFAIRYGAQVNAYALLLTDRYPYAGPPAGAVGEAEPEAPPPAEPVIAEPLY
jgi:hypothetical protein